MLTTGLNFIMIHVADVAAAKKFFTEKLELEVEMEQPDFVQFKLAGGNGAALAVGKGDTTPDIGTELWWYVENANQAFDTLRQRDVAVKEPLHDMPFGRTFSIEGPGGYVLYLLQLA